MAKTSIGIPAVAAVLGCIAGAGAAQAQAIGYVTTNGGNVVSVTSYNSAGGTNSVAILGGGLFQVTLPGLGNGLHSNVQVNAVDFSTGTPHYCTSNGWGSSGSVDVVANVACFDVSGNPANSDFVLFYQARTARPASGKLAFLWADQPTAASYIPNKTYSYSSVDGLNVVSRSSAGRYRASFRRLLNEHGNPQVTAYGSSPARCQIVDWSQDADGTNVDVACVNAAGVGADEYFSLSYAFKTTEAAGPSNLFGGYAWANNPTKRSYTPAKADQLNAITAGPLIAERPQNAFRQAGIYTIVVPNPNGVAFNSYFGMVTAYGSAGEFCNFEEFDVFSTEVDMGSACYDAAGRPLDVQYTATIALGE